VGVWTAGASASGNVIQGNLIGTNVTGTVALGNGLTTSLPGVMIDGASGNLVGGSVPGSRNVISGNGLAGVLIINAGATGNLVQGNLIGTDITGTAALGNGGDGVRVASGASGNTVGGTSAGAGNVIAFNAGNGVTVGLDVLDAALDDAVLQNSIFSNAASGIVVDNTAPQPPPVITGAVDKGPQTTITGTITGIPNASYRVELFANPAGTGQGKTYLGFVTVTTDASGNGSFSFTPASAVAAGSEITATATDPGGNTSEFSAPETVRTDVTAALSVKYGGFVFNRSTRLFSQTLTITNTSGSAITGPIVLVLQNLKNAALVNQSGTFQGNPYVTILAGGSLGAGQSLTVTLFFSDPTFAAISYTAEFLAGPLPDFD
jgi:hypothetical protein